MFPELSLIEQIMIGTGIIMAIATFLCLYRAVVGPSEADRVVSINIIGTKTVVIISIVAMVFDQEFFLDVAMVYALISFATTIGIAKYMEKGALE
ncbi:cation:proton antiporter [Dethiobacter alkaliphilus]|uniref:cation:proton antiporter n=1 Tax=Dethiobacter alkaliphilus TaxID=427926 RepID=UPI0022268F99|nr:cation:proton antiporter [Dethiobacter alkaliphilus]MCW3491366.1 cation:proton antiporter [Dethiobacter alkaliphilus]